MLNDAQWLPDNMTTTDEDDCSTLLAPSQNHEHVYITSAGMAKDATDGLTVQGPTPKDKQPLSRLILYFMTIHFLLSFCELILVAPLISLFEQSLCISYYDLRDPTIFNPGGEVPEHLCKIPEIQTRLATIRGWKSMLDTFPVLLVAIPFGKLADQHGRRKFMAICLLGLAGSYCEVFVICTFPRVFSLRLVLLSSLLLLLGGGLPSAVSLMWAMASESIPEERRSHAFYYIFAAFYIAEFAGSFTAAATTDISPWISCSFSILAIFACLLLLWVAPGSEKSNQFSRSEESVTDEDTTLLDARNSSRSHLAKGLPTALSQKKMLLALPIFLTGSLRFTVLSILIQYASNRFGQKISTGALFYTETAVVNIVLFLFLVPAFTGYLRTKHEVRPQKIDLFMARTCVALLTLGSFIIALSPSSKFLPVGVLVLASGFGSRVSTLSLVSRWISDDTKATLYAAIAVLENLGHAIGDPSLQQVFAATLRLGFPPFWQALPFFVAAGFYCLATLSAICIRLDQNL